MLLKRARVPATLYTLYTNIRKFADNFGIPRARRGERHRRRRRASRSSCVTRPNNRTKSTSAIDRSDRPRLATYTITHMYVRNIAPRFNYLLEDAADVRGDEQNRDTAARHSRRSVVLDAAVSGKLVSLCSPRTRLSEGPRESRRRSTDCVRVFVKMTTMTM